MSESVPQLGGEHRRRADAVGKMNSVLDKLELEGPQDFAVGVDAQETGFDPRRKSWG